MVYVGVDLHRKTAHVVALDQEGDPILSRRVATRPDELLRVFGELDHQPLEVAFEATFGWGWFADLLADAGIPAHMVHPLATKAISSARVKNDSVDAKTLAHLLRTNLLPEAWIAPPEARRLAASRGCGPRLFASAHSSAARSMPCSRSMASTQRCPTSSAKRAGSSSKSSACPPISTDRLEANLRLIDALTDEVAEAERQLRQLFRGDERVTRLMAIPGVGFITAVVVVTEVWDITRFASPDRLCSWAGLTPSEHSSAEHTRRGHISKQGSRWLRWVLVEAAARPQTDPSLRAFVDRIASRRGTKIARVALARRLLTLCFYALRDEGGCRAFPLAG